MLKKVIQISVFLLVSIFIVACSSTQTSPTLTVTTDEVGQNNPTQGGAIVFPVYQDPGNLNPYLAETGETSLIAKGFYEGLAELGPDGTYFPRLARELPTRENGGVSDDGLTITWHLLEDVLWSDGESFTSDDVIFTWEAVTHPESPAFRYSPGWDLIESIEAPDDFTVVVHYSEPYYNYLDQFVGGYVAGILPRHACGDPAEITQWECNRQPVGTGPFILEEWRSGESVTLVRNPNYRESNKPYLDRVTFVVIPDENVRKQMLLRGEGDALLWFNYEHAEELESAGVSVSPGTDQWLVRLWFNLSYNGDLNTPHPILGDIRVRKAIQLAVNPNLINEGILDGRGIAVNHELFRGLTVCPTPDIAYSKETASAMLEEAGWVDQDNDGIRECHGCLYAEDGSTMSMEIITWPDPEAYARMQQLVVDELADVGIELIPNIPEDYYELTVQGDFDIALWDEGYGDSPTWLLNGYYASVSIPEEGVDSGWNFMRFNNAEFDELLDRARTATDPDERNRIFCEIDQLLFEELPVVWLVSMPFPDAFSERLQGWTSNPYDIMTWDIAEWWIKK